MKRPLKDLAICAFILATVVATALIYERGINGPLLYDDYSHLMGFVKRGIVGEGDWEARILSNSGQLKRPIAMASFAFNALTSGADFSRWKHTNVMIHLLAGLCMVWFAASVFLTAGGSRHRAWTLGAIAGGLWLLHPLQVSTVLYTVQRMTELATLFAAAGMILYLQGRSRLQAGATGGKTRIAAAFFIFMPLSCFSKEIGILFPAYCLLIEFVFFGFPKTDHERRFLALCYLVFLVLPLIAGIVIFGPQTIEQLHSAYQARNFTLAERLLTEPRVVVSYLGMILLPVQRHMGFYHDDFPVSTGWLSPPTTVAAFLLIGALLVLAWRLRSTHKVIAFGILLFFTGHLLESTVYPLELMFEHRNYFPSIGILLAAVAGVAGLPLAARLKGAVAMAALCLLAAVTFLRVDTWSSAPKLFSYLYTAHPQSDSAVSTFAEFLADSGQPLDAYIVLSGRKSAGAQLHLLYLECRMSHRLDPSALEAAGGAIGRVTTMYVATALIQIGIAGLDQHCKFPPLGYLSVMNKALKENFLQPVVKYRLMVYKAHYQWKLNQGDEAVQTLEDAYRVYPGDPMSLLLATEWLIDMKQHDRARQEFARAVVVAKASPFDYSRLVEKVGYLLRHASTSAP